MGRGFESAVVAAQAPVGLMQDEVGGTAMAAREPAAGGAGEYRRIAAAVEEDEALLPAFEPFGKGASKAAPIPSLSVSPPAIHQGDRGQLGIGNRPLGEGQQTVATNSRVGPTFPTPGSPNRDHGNTGLLSAKDGHIARRVAHAVLLLERGIVPLVDDDQPLQVGHAGETPPAGSEDDGCLAGKAYASCAPGRPRQVRCAAPRRWLRKTRADAEFKLGVRLISGTRTRAWRPAARVA